MASSVAASGRRADRRVLTGSGGGSPPSWGAEGGKLHLPSAEDALGQVLDSRVLAEELQRRPLDEFLDPVRTFSAPSAGTSNAGSPGTRLPCRVARRPSSRRKGCILSSCSALAC